MDNGVEHELCNNCKKDIPAANYVMHTAHCPRHITLCSVCKEPFPKKQFEDHRKQCKEKPKPFPKPEVPLTTLEKSDYFKDRKTVEDKKAAARRASYLERHEKFTSNGYSLRESSLEKEQLRKSAESKEKSRTSTDRTESSYRRKDEVKTNGYSTGSKTKETKNTNTVPIKPNTNTNTNTTPMRPLTTPVAPKVSSGMLECKFCDLELPKMELEDHENYCGSRTDKCLQCGELVMYKYKQLHMDSNHGFLKLNDEPGPRPTWDSTTERSRESPPMRRPSPFTPFTTVDATLYSFPTTVVPPPKEKGESYKEISRRLDCKTEYIRNLLHDSASITVPLRHNGAVPRNHFNHNKGPAPKPPRRRNPPTELVIPCEFCSVPIPHEDLIQHETGCRPDLARRRRSASPLDEFFTAAASIQPTQAPSSPEVELPCEFCADMIPASQLLRHQATCV